MKKLASIVAVTALIQGCSGPSPAPVENKAPAKAESAAPAPVPAQRQAQAQAQSEPKPATIDPKSTEAAVDLAQAFARLVNQRKFDEAYMLLGPGAPARAEFDKQFSALSDLKAVIGTAGDQEGAAGSIYLSVPLTLSGTSGGKRVSRSATLVMRRVNDVPGSTEAQRRWHIERIDWGTTP